jgi:5-methylcytosine-specific restriction endonuclease McrA
MKRTAIKTRIVRNKLLRKRVFERDGGICCDCQRYDARWEHDHQRPLSMGGRDDLDNSVTRCRECHRRKTSGEAPLRAKADRLAERHHQTRQRKPVREST